jgi:hypothetical protein
MNALQEVSTNNHGSFFRGLGIGFGSLLVYVFLAWGCGAALNSVPRLQTVSGLVLGSLMFVGLVQFLYIVPLAFRARRAGRPNEVKGLLTAASVVVLFNATCWYAFSRAFR